MADGMESIKKSATNTFVLAATACLVGGVISVALAPYSSLGAVIAGALVPIGFFAWMLSEGTKLLARGEHPYQEELEASCADGLPEVDEYEIVGLGEYREMEPLACFCSGCGKQGSYRLPEGWDWAEDPWGGEQVDMPPWPLCPKCFARVAEAEKAEGVS